ncbi:MAG: lactonase family protein [Planctomycetaceae bacterium]
MFRERTVLILGLLALWACSSLAPVQAEVLRFYIGTYTGPDAGGIYQATLDTETGALGPASVAGAVKNPSFLAVHPADSTLWYSVCEFVTADGKPTGGVAAWRQDPATGRLTLLGQSSSGGAGPCHLTVDRRGKFVLVANYGGGSVASLPLDPQGNVGPAVDVQQHRGSGANPSRQQAPHAHSVNLDAAGNFAFVADLGLDQVFVYRLIPETGRLVPHDPPAVRVTAGAGPRHLGVHPSGKFVYVINELGNTISVFGYDAQAGKLSPLQELGTLPQGFAGESYTAEVVAHPNGRFVYGSNRGHDSVAVFAVDAATGRLTARGHQSTGGQTPRNFAIDPTGRWLLAENQKSNSVVVFAIDGDSGALRETGHRLEVPSPVCIRFTPPAAK